MFGPHLFPVRSRKVSRLQTNWDSLKIVCFIISSSTVLAKAVVWSAIRISLHIGVRLLTATAVHMTLSTAITHSSPLISHCVSIAVVTKVAGCIIIDTSPFNRHNLHPPFYFPHFTSTNHSLTFFVRISGWPSRRLRRAATLP